VDDDKLRVMIAHLLDHPVLAELDLSHNVIGDRGNQTISVQQQHPDSRCPGSGVTRNSGPLDKYLSRALPPFSLPSLPFPYPSSHSHPPFPFLSLPTPSRLSLRPIPTIPNPFNPLPSLLSPL